MLFSRTIYQGNHYLSTRYRTEIVIYFSYLNGVSVLCKSKIRSAKRFYDNNRKPEANLADDELSKDSSLAP